MNNNNPSVIIGNEENFAQTVSGTGYTPKIRITFSYSITNHTTSFVDSFYLNNSSLSNFPASPITIDTVKNTSTNKICGPGVATRNYTAYARAVLISKKDTENNRLKFNLKAEEYNLEGGNYDAYFTVSLTVTKIEQYY